MVPSEGTVWLAVMAHPDDESMFFAPTLRSILARRRRRRRRTSGENCDGAKNVIGEIEGASGRDEAVEILCLSNGDYGNPSAGPVRARELRDAAAILGLGTTTAAASRETEEGAKTTVLSRGSEGGDARNGGGVGDGSVTVLDDLRMRDGPNEAWNAEVVAETVVEHVRGSVVPRFFAGDVSRGDSRGNVASPDPSAMTTATADKTSNPRVSSWTYVEGSRIGVPVKPGSDAANATHTIDLNILTFDSTGVSRHPNHVDLHLGIKRLLLEKCRIIRRKQDSVGGVASKSAAREAVLAFKGRLENAEGHTENCVVHVRLSVFALRTVSNPLLKYALWPLADVLPFFIMWLLRLLQLVLYFLLGGIFWNPQSKLNSQNNFTSMFPPSGISSSPSKQTSSSIRCRIFDPVLVWRAMAAHTSQFVWYRRLSVAFSRYTYINDLEEIAIADDDVAFDDEDTEDDDALLPPPVSPIDEGDSAPAFLLNRVQMTSLRDVALPASLHHRPWKRVYSLSRDGDSFVAFHRLVAEWNGRGLDGHPTVLIVQTTAGELAGVYADVPWVKSKFTSTGSGARSRLLRMIRKRKDRVAASDDGEGCGNVRDDELEIQAVGQDPSSFGPEQILCDPTRRVVAFGSGGNSDGGFALCLEDGFMRGTAARCDALGGERLMDGDGGGVFEVLDIEVWGFVSGTF